MLMVMMAPTMTNISSMPTQGAGAFWFAPGWGGGMDAASVAALIIPMLRRAAMAVRSLIMIS